MGMFKSFFAAKTAPLPDYSVLGTDVHSHFIPRIDDGSQSVEESLELLELMQKLGYRKVITTPHVMSDFYANTPESILAGLETLRAAAAEKGLDIQVEAAAEYFLDEGFVQKLESGEKLLTFGDRYLLFEMSFVNQPPNLYDVIFRIQVQGYRPVLAHPERYPFLHGRLEEYRKIKNTGVLFITNTIALSGYYEEQVREAAQLLIDNRMVDLLASDAHHSRHLAALGKTLAEPYLRKVLEADLLNSTL
jgi:protein-tyrosine phosphatase